MKYLLSQEEYDALLEKPEEIKAEFNARFNLLTDTLHRLKMISCRHMMPSPEHYYCDEKCLDSIRGGQCIAYLCTKPKKWSK